MNESPDLKNILHDGNRYLALTIIQLESFNGQTWSHLGQFGDNFSENFDLVGTAYGNGKYVGYFLKKEVIIAAVIQLKTEWQR